MSDITNDDGTVKPDNTHITDAKLTGGLKPLNTHITDVETVVAADDDGTVTPDNTHITSNPT